MATSLAMFLAELYQKYPMIKKDPRILKHPHMELCVCRVVWARSFFFNGFLMQRGKSWGCSFDSHITADYIILKSPALHGAFNEKIMKIMTRSRLHPCEHLWTMLWKQTLRHPAITCDHLRPCSQAPTLQQKLSSSNSYGKSPFLMGKLTINGNFQ